MPLFGAYVADQYWGRYKTINFALGVDIIGHIILTMSAVPSVIPNRSGSIACMILGILVIGFGTGGFKPNVNPVSAPPHSIREPSPFSTTDEAVGILALWKDEKMTNILLADC